MRIYTKLAVSSATIAIIALLAVGTVACSTTKSYRIPEVEPQYSDQDIQLSLRLLSEDELIERYGRNNPFIAPYRGITPFQFLAVELFVEHINPQYEVDTLNVTGAFNNIGADLMHTTRLLRFWEKEIDNLGADSVDRRYRQTIRAVLVPRYLTDQTLGLMVFRGQFPQQGTVIINIPLQLKQFANDADAAVPNTAPLGGSNTVVSAQRTDNVIELAIPIRYREETVPFSLF